MSWVTARSATEFLEYVNTYIRLVDGKMERIPHDERMGQKTLGFNTPARLTFAFDIDLVIEGQCSESIEQDSSLQFPMGKCMKVADKGGKPDRSWLHEIVKSSGTKKVLVFPQCCGSYSERFKDLVHEALPAIEWHFPNVHDLCDNSHDRLDQLCQCFIAANLMRAEATMTTPAK